MTPVTLTQYNDPTVGDHCTGTGRLLSDRIFVAASEILSGTV